MTQIFVNTDHKPLTYGKNSTTERSSHRQTRHLAYIAEFTTDIRYVKRETNFVADATRFFTILHGLGHPRTEPRNLL